MTSSANAQRLVVVEGRVELDLHHRALAVVGAAGRSRRWCRGRAPRPRPGTSRTVVTTVLAWSTRATREGVAAPEHRDDLFALRVHLGEPLLDDRRLGVRAVRRGTLGAVEDRAAEHGAEQPRGRHHAASTTARRRCTHRPSRSSTG